MKHLIDSNTGVVVFIPESKADRLLLLHIMDCNDMIEFSEYIGREWNGEPMTRELGVTGPEVIEYMCSTAALIKVTEETGKPAALLPEQNSSSGGGFGKVIGFKV